MPWARVSKLWLKSPQSSCSKMGCALGQIAGSRTRTIWVSGGALVVNGIDTESQTPEIANQNLAVWAQRALKSTVRNRVGAPQSEVHSGCRRTFENELAFRRLQQCECRIELCEPLHHSSGFSVVPLTQTFSRSLNSVHNVQEWENRINFGDGAKW